MHLCIVGLLALIQRAAAWHNITVDNTSSDIVYSGPWLQSGYRTDRYGGTTHYTVRPVGFLTQFTIGFIQSGWPDSSRADRNRNQSARLAPVPTVLGPP